MSKRVLNTNTTSIKFSDKWESIRILGEGATSNVVLVRDLPTKKTQALKLENENLHPEIFKNEAEILSQISHPRIISTSQFYPKIALSAINQLEVGIAPTQSSQHCSGLVLEYVPNGDLTQLISDIGYLPEVIARGYFQQLVEAIDHLHSSGICHLDIKPDNILLDESYSIKLSDFGLAQKLPKSHIIKRVVGTVEFHAPEIFEKQGYNGYQADLYALGITLFAMVSGMNPFLSAEHSDPIYRLLLEDNWAQFWEYHEGLQQRTGFFSQSFRELVQGMLEPDRARRLSLEEIKEQKWFKESVVSENRQSHLIQLMLNK